MRAISVGKNLTAGTETIVYKVPLGYTAKWTLLYAHNGSAGAKTLTVDWYDVSATTHVSILDAYSFASKGYFQFNAPDTGVILEEGDEVHMTPEAGSSFGIICTFEIEKKQGI